MACLWFWSVRSVAASGPEICMWSRGSHYCDCTASRCLSSVVHLFVSHHSGRTFYVIGRFINLWNVENILWCSPGFSSGPCVIYFIHNSQFPIFFMWMTFSFIDPTLKLQHCDPFIGLFNNNLGIFHIHLHLNAQKTNWVLPQKTKSLRSNTLAPAV